jgi:hypothetical protein
VVVAITSAALGQSRSPVAPTEQAYTTILKEAYINFKDDTNGKNADCRVGPWRGPGFE